MRYNFISITKIVQLHLSLTEAPEEKSNKMQTMEEEKRRNINPAGKERQVGIQRHREFSYPREITGKEKQSKEREEKYSD